MTVSTCDYCKVVQQLKHDQPAYCAQHQDPTSIGIDFHHVVSIRVSPAELQAVDVAIREILCVLEREAHDQNHGSSFMSDDYSVQINQAEDHLRARGKLDVDSGLDQLKHALTRLVFAVALHEQPSGGAAKGVAQ